jgi:hypothetical protein
MATKPTRLQQQACDRLADALFSITEAFRLDGRGRLDPDDLVAIAGLVARVSSAFTLDEIVVRALARRAKGLGLSSDTADLITLLEGESTPLQTLRLPDAEFRQLVEKLEQDLGGV